MALTFDSFLLAAITSEIENDLLAARLVKVHHPAPGGVVLTYGSGQSRQFWLHRFDGRWPRAHRLTERPANPATPSAFCMTLRKHLEGARLQAVEQPGFDRILKLTFTRGGGRNVLVHEMMGRHSNLLLLDGAEQILAVGRPISKADGAARDLIPHAKYQLPPHQRPDPRGLSTREITALLGDGPLEPADITRAVNGVGPFAARELLTVGADPATVADALAAMLERWREGDLDPQVLTDAHGEPEGAWPWRSRHWPEDGQRSTPSASGAVEEAFGALEQDEARTALRRQAGQALKRALRTASAQLKDAERHLLAAEDAELLRIKGELLVSAPRDAVKAAADCIELPNYYDPEGKPLAIEIDPRRTLHDNAERYFRRYQRVNAAREDALVRHPRLLERVDALETARTALAQARSEADIHALVAPLGLRPASKRQRAQRGERTQSPYPPGVRIRGKTVDGWEILYGENATGNDYLTTRVARPDDLWLHARAVKGAHVVIRGVGDLGRLPPEVLREAAQLAAARSDAKHSRLVTVDYTFKRYVRKPRKAAPGLVLVSHEKSLEVDPGG